MKSFCFESPNYTQTPNDLFDQLLKEIDDLSELKVTLAAVRMTIGYHKETAELSIEYLHQMTGLARNSVRRGLAIAIRRGSIRVVKASTHRTGGIYALNVRVSATDTHRGATTDIPEYQPLTPLKKTVKQKEKEISPPKEKSKPDANFGVFVKEIERRTSRLTPRDYERIGELWDEWPELDAHIFAFDEIDKRGVAFNFVYYEKCLFSWRDLKERKKNGGYLKTNSAGAGAGGNGNDRRDDAPRGNLGTREPQSALRDGAAKQIPRVPG